MKRSLIAAALIGLGLLAATGVASAQVRADMGRLEYEANCLACHGKEGKGDGYYSKVINVKMPDITTIAKRNGGVFPVEKVMMLIDGRDVPPAHGVRQMPIWGIDYSLKSAEIYKNFPTHDPETYVRVRILALVDYLYLMQGR
ncbi:MAG: cytochrome c [Burkholderiaceae bacterium]|jgi:mono/diheme cytochrome c family protein|nr:cytochrome c [Burkholderiaceae bacterium]